jgi:CHAT domain-containing protein
MEYWGASDADRLADFRTYADAATFLDGDKMYSPTGDASHLLGLMIELAQAADDPAEMFATPEFQKVLATPPQRYASVNAGERYRELLKLAVSSCTVADISDACLGSRLDLARVRYVDGDVDAALEAIEPVVATLRGTDGNPKVEFFRRQVDDLRAKKVQGVDSLQSARPIDARRAMLDATQSGARRALIAGRPDDARRALAGLPRATSGDPTLAMRRTLAFVDGDRVAAGELARIDGGGSGACDVQAFILAHPNTSEFPTKGITGCTESRNSQRDDFDRFWLQAVMWSPRDPEVRQTASSFSTRWISKLIRSFDSLKSAPDSPVAKYLDDDDIQLVSKLISIALERKDNLRSEVDNLYRAFQAVTLGPLALSVGERIAQRRAIRTDPKTGVLIREYRELKKPTIFDETTRISPDKSLGRLDNPLDKLRRERELVSEISHRAPEYFSSVVPKLYNISETQRLLRPNEALVVLSPAAHGTIAFAITADGFAWSAGDWDPSKVHRAVTRLRWDVYGEPEIPPEVERRWIRDAGRGLSYDRRLAHELYKEVFGGVAGALLGKESLFVVAAGDLAAIPMGILVTEGPKGSDTDPAELRATDWLADRFAITALPSIQMLDLLRLPVETDRKDVHENTFAGFGDPSLSGVAATRGERSASGRLRAQSRSVTGARQVNSIGELIELPGTRAELLAMRNALGGSEASVRLSGAATEAAFRAAQVERPAILALATHGVMPYEIKGVNEGSLILTPGARGSEDDGILRSSEVAAMNLKSDWVILSACNSGATGGRVNGLMGLPEAFLFAGARSLLVSHWPVLDVVAPVLTVRTIEIARDRQIDKAHALQAAMREVRNNVSEPDWSHPSAWAPFELVGLPEQR